MLNGNTPESLEMTVSRLYSQDANDRVKAAGELGEIGTPEIAPKLLAVAYEDEASTVRQMAIQSYGEILEKEAIADLVKAARSHFDEYVRLYAMNMLGTIGGEGAEDVMLEMMEDDNPRLQATALRAMIHANTSSLAPQVFDKLKRSSQELIVRNCIEALSHWKYGEAKEYILEHYFENDAVRSLELKTISAFYLCALGEKKGRKYLENEQVDMYVSIMVDDVHYRGSKGLLEAASKLG